ncbi:MAG: peroxiredoxin family protein [Candidatus Poribacteria bacterium]
MNQRDELLDVITEQHLKRRSRSEKHKQTQDAVRAQKAQARKRRKKYKKMIYPNELDELDPSKRSEKPSRPLAIIASIMVCVLIGAMIVAALYLRREPSMSPESTTTSIPPITSLPSEPPLALDFLLKDVVSSETIHLAEFRGYPILLEFFQLQCSACDEYLPHLRAVYHNSKYEHLVIISISAWATDSEEALRQFVIDEEIPWWVAWDSPTTVFQNGTNQSVTEAYKIKYTPTTILIDQTGRIFFKRVGIIEVLSLMSEIDKLLDS